LQRFPDELFGKRRAASVPIAEVIHELNRDHPTTRQRGGVKGITRMPRDFSTTVLRIGQEVAEQSWFAGPRLVTIAPKPPFGEVIWKMLSLLWNAW